jgi:hypothetical protein
MTPMQIQIVTPANAKAHSNMIVGSVQFCVNPDHARITSKI